MLFTLLTGSALAEKKSPLKVQADTSKIAVKQFNKSALDKFRADKDFNYNGNGIGKPSAWELFWAWLWNGIGKLFNRIPFGGRIFQYTLIAICVSFLVYVVLKSLGIDAINLWRGEAVKIGLSYNESTEDIHEINFDAELEKAVTQGNYRLAVRLLYLSCLKQLNDKGLIKWQIDKTNSAYLQELADPQQKQAFGLLTRQFEYAWYGNFFIHKQAYTNISLLFQNFKKHLS
ncbi:MAG: DUF4129 domain-containing protein [Mucilaginibacter sp.]